MIIKKSKYGVPLMKNRIKEILAALGMAPSENSKSVQIYETFKDYMSLEQCSRKEAIDFTAKYYHLSKPQLKQILSNFSQD